MSKTHTCSHDHPFVGCGMANSQEKAEPSTGQEDETIYDDLPSLIALSDDEDDDYREKYLADDWFWKILGSPIAETPLETGNESVDQGHLHVVIESVAQQITEVLTKSQPFPGDEQAMEPMLKDRVSRFTIELIQYNLIHIYNRVQGFDAHLHLSLAQSTKFAIERWYAERCAHNSELPLPWEVAQQWEAHHLERNHDPGEEQMDHQRQLDRSGVLMELNGVQVDCNKYLSLQ